MKKIMLIALSAALVFSLTSCSGGGSVKGNASAAGSKTAESAAQSGKTGAGEDKLLSGSFVNIMKSGKFLMRYKTSVDIGDGKADAEITAAVDGKNVGTVYKSDDISTHTILRDNVLYFLDDEKKTYIRMNTGISSGQNGQIPKTGDLTGTEDLKYTGSGTAQINGKTLPYEEYVSGGTTMRFFVNGRDLYAISSKSEGVEMQMIILELSGSIPDGLLSIPAGYTESTAAAVPGGEEQTEMDEG